MADELPTGCADVVEGAFAIPNLADVASLDPVTKNGDDASMDPVIKEGASVWNLMTKNVASLVPVTKCGAVASLGPVTKNGDVASLGTDAYPRGAYPDGAYPNGAYPDGAYPDGAYPNGAYPNGAYPNGAYPDGAYSNGDDASMDPVIKEGVDAGAELEECEVRGSPSGSKVRFSVRVRLLHLSNHLNRGELAEKAAIGDAEKSTSGDVDKGTRRCGAPLRWCACKVQCRGCRQCECADCINQDM